jgi:hypothetical protein
MDLKARLTHWKSTGAGLAVAGIVMYAFNSLGCHAPSDWTLWAVGLVSALPGVLSKG